MLIDQVTGADFNKSDFAFIKRTLNVLQIAKFRAEVKAQNARNLANVDVSDLVVYANRDDFYQKLSPLKSFDIISDD